MKKQFNIDLCIPKINDLSDYLKKSTGFQIKPVPGIISQRSFLNCLAFKVFCSSQFIRHSLTENFAPEPDIIHEYIGHIPMFANQ
jgi:phenylalanine-4-hydroxylase